MKVFGTKQRELTDEDRAAAARLSAVAARFKSGSSTDFTEASPDPLGEPQAFDESHAYDAQEAPAEWEASGIEDASEEPQDPEVEE